MAVNYYQNNMSTILWFTGLSGSGKTTLAFLLKEKLEQGGKTVTIVDGDTVRDKYEQKLGFTRADIIQNNDRITTYITEIKNQFDFILVPVIAPFSEVRAANKTKLGADYLEIYVSCPVAVCAERDVKGLYAKAERGEIEAMIGIDPQKPYEVPTNPDLIIDTVNQSQSENIEALLEWLKGLQKI